MRYTDIGAGPGGRTFIYVLSKDNKKGKPVSLIDRFNHLHQG